MPTAQQRVERNALREHLLELVLDNMTMIINALNESVSNAEPIAEFLEQKGESTAACHVLNHAVLRRNLAKALADMSQRMGRE